MDQLQTKPSPIIYGIVAWMVINILLMALLILNCDYMDLNNWIEIALWVTSIGSLLPMRKWGAAFAIFTLAYTLSTSVGILIYYFASDPQVGLNFVRIINVPIIIYLFQALFKGKFK